MEEWKTGKCRYTQATVTNLHVGGPGHRVALHWTKAAVGFSSSFSDRAALFRIALPTSWHKEGARKGALNITCFNSPWSANCSLAGTILSSTKFQAQKSWDKLHFRVPIISRDRTNRPLLFRDRISNCTNLFRPEPNRTTQANLR